MKQYQTKSKVPTIILWAVVILITVGLIVAIIVGAVHAKNSENEDPSQIETTEENKDPVTDTETDIPAIDPGHDTGNENTDVPSGSEEAGNASVDILEENKDNEKEDQPHVVGEPTVIPGIKEAENETSN